MSWDPLREGRAWQERLERLTAPQVDSWTPPIDVYESRDCYVISAELPGITRDQVDLALEDARLTLRGRRADRAQDRSDVVHYHQVERGHGGFVRTFDFADKIDVVAVSAHLSGGVLTITLPKVSAPPTRRIEVR